MTMLVSCAFAAPTLAFATESNVYEVGDSEGFNNAVAAINGKTSGDYVIKLAADIESEASVSGPCPVTILGCGHTLTIGTNGSLQVEKGSQLSLGAADGSDTLTIKGSGEQSIDAPGLLYVDGGSCDMYAGVTLTGREGNNYYGGGVTVYGGTFHMHGGTIENCGINGGSVCYGGGVGVVNDYYTGAGGTFIMDGGEIKGCYAIAPSVPGLTFQSYGGGVFVAYGSSFTMNGGTISGNRADVGGGVMLSDNSAEMKIGGGSITGNTATICGGGLAAVGNDGAVVVNNAKLCNNVANGAASDVYLANTPARLSPAESMGERYLGSKPDDVTNERIDGWYVDDETSRYFDQSKEKRRKYPDYANIGPGDEVCLIAAGSGSLSEFHAKYEFQSATPGQQLPDEVLALLPADGTRYPRGSEIGALAPSQTSVETADGTWTFVGYDRTSAEASMDNADNEGNVHFSGTWKFTRKATPAQPGDGGATAGANPAGKADGASSEGAQLPQTSDAFGPGALLALIAAGATSLIAAAAIRK